MSLERIKNRFLGLSLFNKLIAIASFLTVISVAMPWYEDLDQFHTGDMFLGITGPLYLAGFVMLLAAGISFGLILMKVIDKKAPKLPMKESHVHIAAGVMNLFLLILVNSVYFHTKFGVNIALKESRFGMILAFVGTVLLLVAAVMLERSEKPDFNLQSGKIEPLIDIQAQREQRKVEPSTHHNEEIAQPVESVGGEELYEKVEAVKTGSGLEKSVESKKAPNDSQPWRMDL